MFSVGSYLKIWGVNDKGNYAEVECSSSKKNKQTEKYETDFSSKFVRFIGEAYSKRPQKDERVKITNCAVQNVYEKDGQKQYLKNPYYLVYDFERVADRNNTQSNNAYIPNAYGSPSFAKNSPNFEELPDSDGLPF